MSGLRGAIAAGSKESAEAGREMYELGGNAIDAAIAASFATAAGDPAITGLAGGGVLLFRDGASRRTHVCDFFANAPGLGGRRRASRRDALPAVDFPSLEVEFEKGTTPQTFHIGRGAAAVPGILPGLCAARERWGRLPLRSLVTPVVRFLRRGVTLSEYQARCSTILREILRRSDLGRKLFFDTSGRLVTAGRTFRNPLLADLLERLGGEGLDVIQREIVFPGILAEFGEEQGGWITPADLVQYAPCFPHTFEVTYRDARVSSGTAASFGGAFVGHTLNLFQHAAVSQTPRLTSERFARIVSVFRAVSEARTEMPDLVERPNARDILSRRLDDLLAGRNGPPAASRAPGGPGNTTHISTVDSAGNVVSVTLSHGEGNGHAVPGTGLLMNNLLGEADLFPQGFHRFTPGQRLSTMMAPTIVEEPAGTVTALGSGGSNRIRTVIPQVVSALLDDQLTLGEAVHQARVHFEEGVLSVEAYLLNDHETALARAARLAARVESFQTPSLFFGGVHVARRGADGRLEAVGDPRRGGAAGHA